MEPPDRAADGGLGRLRLTGGARPPGTTGGSIAGVTGAVALTVVLVIVVMGLSLAMQSQQTMQGTRVSPPARPARSPSAPKRTRERKPQPAASDVPPPSAEPAVGETDVNPPDLLRTGEQTDAKIISVVDERTIGPVTRSRLTVEITPADGDPFEVTTRVAFPTQEARARVKVGGTVKVHYDKDDHSRVVVDIPADPAGGPSSPEPDGPNHPSSP